MYKKPLHCVHLECRVQCRRCLRAVQSSCVQCRRCWTPFGTSRRLVETSVLAVRCVDPLPTWLPAARYDVCLNQCSVHSADPASVVHMSIITTATRPKHCCIWYALDNYQQARSMHPVVLKTNTVTHIVRVLEHTGIDCAVPKGSKRHFLPFSLFYVLWHITPNYASAVKFLEVSCNPKWCFLTFKHFSERI